MRGEAWDDETLTLLKRLWSEGKTRDAMPPRLGGMSRSAVMGKIFRLRLGAARQRAPKAKRAAKAGNKKPSAATRHPAPSRRRRGRTKADTAKAPRAAAGSRRKTLLELTNTCCRWPLGRPGGKGFFFCGAADADLEGGRPYCDRHMRRAYIVAPAIAVKTQRLDCASRVGCPAKRGRHGNGGAAGVRS